MSSERLARVGVVGAGWWSTTAHLPALARDPRVALVGIADTNRTRAKQAADRFGAALATDSVEELFAAGLDGVVIATPHDQHYEPAREALTRDIDVLLEKPMTVQSADARELVALSRTRGRRLDVGYPFLYTRHVRALKQVVDTGALGDVVTATGLFASQMMALYTGNVEVVKDTKPETMWATNQSTWASSARGGGQLLSQVTHAASLLLHLTDLRPETLFAATHNYTMDVDVWDVIAFKTSQGAVASLASTGTVGLGTKQVEEYRIFGTTGHASLSTSEGTLVVDQYGSSPMVELPLGEDEIYPLYAPATRLVDGILDRSLADTAELGLRTVELLAAAHASAETGAPVTLGPTA